MRHAVQTLWLLLFTGCVKTTGPGYPEPVRICVDEGAGEHSESRGIPWGDCVIAAAHVGRVIERHLGTTTLVLPNGDRLSLFGPPVFSEQDDWCLLRPAKRVEIADLELREKPPPAAYIVLSGLAGQSSRLVPCGPAPWRRPAEGTPERSAGADPDTVPSSQGLQPCERGRTFGLRALVMAAQPIEPGASGSPVIFYDPQAKRFRVCGMVVGRDEDCATMVQIVPFWKVGKELVEKRDSALKEFAKNVPE